jgi:adenosylhomocysteine nucleosidase
MADTLGMGAFSRITAAIAALVLSTTLARADDIAFFYALEADFATFKNAAMVLGEPAKIGARAVQRLRLGAHTIYALKMGSGAVETAVSAEALLARFRCDRAFSLGPVGALGEALKVGEWVTVKEVVAYQKGAWGSAGFALGEKARMAGGEKTGADLERPALWQQPLPVAVASGEIFIASDNYRAELGAAARAEVVDMNLFGLVTACANHEVPLVSWRIVSDRADKNASADFQKFVANYDGAGGAALAEVIRNLPANPNAPSSYPKLRELLEGGVK